jgi:hypothetical protein
MRKKCATRHFHSQSLRSFWSAPRNESVQVKLTGTMFSWFRFYKKCMLQFDFRFVFIIALSNQKTAALGRGPKGMQALGTTMTSRGLGMRE